ncbi:hypothetical protein AKO1_013904 [Acrasis kona]|uniref:Tyr recombinase domain-containing protein n=1 Tax=Acrasis kona TaxID=1008807 RepID=A0AAW2ZF34_9EUKA
MENIRSGISDNQFEIWSVPSRTFCFNNRSTRGHSKILFKGRRHECHLGASFNRSRMGSRRIFRRVGINTRSTTNGKLLCTTTATHHENNSSHGENQKRRNNCGPKMAVRPMVASTNVHRRGLVRCQPYGGAPRGIGDAQKSGVGQMDCSQSTGSSILRNSVEATRRSLMTASLSKGTLKKYESEWNKFCSYCEFNDEQEMPASVDILESYMYFMLAEGRGASVNTMRAAVTYFHNKNNQYSPTNDPRIPIAAKLCLKHWKKNRKRLKRDPFPLVALKIYAKNRPPHTSEFIHSRNIALIANCFRGMMRAGEIVKTVRTSFSFQEDASYRYINWDLGVTKTDLEGVDSEVPLDEGSADSNICPYKSMKYYLEQYCLRFGEPEGNDRIFVKEDGSHMLTKDVTNIIKEMIWNAGLAVQCSAHSLRSGGATEAAKAGVPISVIMAIGRWKTDCVLRYIRAICGAAQNLSASMGM